MTVRRGDAGNCLCPGPGQAASDERLLLRALLFSLRNVRRCCSSPVAGEGVGVCSLPGDAPAGAFPPPLGRGWHPRSQLRARKETGEGSVQNISRTVRE